MDQGLLFHHNRMPMSDTGCFMRIKLDYCIGKALIYKGIKALK